MPHSETLIVMGRLPGRSRGKTRLAEALAPEDRAALTRALLGDVLAGAELARRRRRCGARFAYAVDESDGAGADDAAVARAWLPGPEWAAVAQSGADLGARLGAALSASGAEAVVFLGTDAPHQAPEVIEAAFDALAGRDVVFAPALDGGYTLLGLRRSAAAVLEDIPWSTAEVAKATRRRAEALGHSVQLLSLCFDIDRPEDLDRLWALPDAERRAPRTYAWLASVLRPR